MDAIEDEIACVQREIGDVIAKIASVEEELEKLEQRITDKEEAYMKAPEGSKQEKLAERQLKQLREDKRQLREDKRQLREDKRQLREDKRQLRDKESQLRDEKKQLRRKEEQLRDEKKQLRDSKQLLIKEGEKKCADASLSVTSSAAEDVVELVVELRPWEQQYTAVDPVTVSTGRALWEAADSACGQTAQRLYFLPPGQPKNRQHVMTRPGEPMVPRGWGAVSVLLVWCHESSPPVSPEKGLGRRKHFSSSIPDFYEDECFGHLMGFLHRAGEKQKIATLFATPGSGKTRTVSELRSRAGEYTMRQKTWLNFLGVQEGLVEEAFGDDGEREIDYRTLMNVLKPASRAMVLFSMELALWPELRRERNYDEQREWFAQQWRKKRDMDKLDAAVGERIREMSNSDKSDACMVVVHFDEVQLLMGENEVNSGSQSKFPLSQWRNCVIAELATACDAYQSEHVKVVMSGTNCFAPKVVNLGSAVTPKSIPMDGLFPASFVSELMAKYLSVQVTKSRGSFGVCLRKAIEFVRFNRRVTYYFLTNLEDRLTSRRRCSEEDIARSRMDAVDTWMRETLLGDMQAQVVGAVYTLLCIGTMESGSGGGGGGMLRGRQRVRGGSSKHEWSHSVQVLRSQANIKEVLLYATAGGLCVSSRVDETVTVVVPEGCMKYAMEEKAKNKAALDVSVLMAAVEWAQLCRVGTQGHVFCRALALELGMLGSTVQQQLLSNANGGGVRYLANLLSTCSGLVHAGVLSDMSVEDLGNTLWVEWDDPKDIGARWVDVAFAAYRVSGDDECISKCPVWLEVKNVREKGKLWKACNTFFERVVENCERRGVQAVGIFVSWHSFLAHTPREGSAAAQARQNALALMEKHSGKLGIYDAVGEHRTMLDIGGLLDKCTAAESRGVASSDEVYQSPSSGMVAADVPCGVLRGS